MRDIEKRVEEGKRLIRTDHKRMDMSFSELASFHKMIKSGEDMTDIIGKAFYLGVSVGARCVK